MSFESRFLRSKKQDHCVKEKICLYVIMSKNTLQIFNLSVDRTQHAVSLLFCGWQFDSEGGAESEFGAFNEDFAVMVLFDNAFGERESESPTTLFGGVARLEDRFEFVALDAST